MQFLYEMWIIGALESDNLAFVCFEQSSLFLAFRP